MAIHENGSDHCGALAARLNLDASRFILEPRAGRRAVSSDLAARFEPSAPGDTRAHLLAHTAFFVSRRCAQQMAEVITAVEKVVARPEYQERALGHASSIARLDPGPLGVFFGYDFHLHGEHPQLIEINTNAGGALINTTAAKAWSLAGNGLHPASDAIAQLERDFVEMFRSEWKRKHDAPLASIAIVDAEPDRQYLSPEFHLFRQLFQQHGIAAVVADRSELHFRGEALWCRDLRVDLVYNRLTDFSLSEPSTAVLREAYLSGRALVTPHPRAHALYADKRNLTLLSDDALLSSWGITSETRAVLRVSIPRTVVVSAENRDRLWAERRGLFFKPAGGFGGKAAYRGDKLTHRVWEEILGSVYVAQTLVPPSRRLLEVEGGAISLKVDVRNYAYQGRVQLLAARMYEGQTTNFRTAGGGFANVCVVDDARSCALRLAGA